MTNLAVFMPLLNLALAFGAIKTNNKNMNKISLSWLCLLFCLGLSQFSQAQDEKQEKRKAVDFENYLMPGAGYSMFFPRDTELGLMHGLSIEFVFFSQAERKLRGPSHYRLYSRLNLLQSDKDTINGAFLYGFGGNFSFESTVYRNFMIPYFGLELGGIHQSQVANSFQFSPQLGLHVVSTENISFNIFGAYTIATRSYDRLSGYHVGATLNVSFW